MRVTWMTTGGRTNVLQAMESQDAGYSNDFTDLSAPIVIVGFGDTTTNYVDEDAAILWPARYYRVRFVP
jgi:hypothetical protein